MFHRLGLANGLRRARKDEVEEAKAYMVHKAHHGHSQSDGDDEEVWEGEVWGKDEVEQFKLGKLGRCVVLIRGFVVDVTSYLGEHVGFHSSLHLHDLRAYIQPGGAALLRRYSVRNNSDTTEARDATWAFDGGLNNHSRAAKRRMRELRVAKYRA